MNIQTERYYEQCGAIIANVGFSEWLKECSQSIHSESSSASPTASPFSISFGRGIYQMREIILSLLALDLKVIQAWPG